jgi:hypothetical protein
VYRRDGMIRVRRYGERYGAIMRWTKDLMDICGVRAVKEQQKATILVPPTAIQLNQQPVSLATLKKVVMDSYTLSWDKPMCGRVNPATKMFPR